jgi:uncharacterized protein YjeT (DUF2065 family)
MADRRANREFEQICEVAAFRAGLVLRTVEALVPDATPRQKKRIANRILTLCDGKDRSVKITQAQAQDLILPHMQCIAKECPELIFWEPIARSLNLFFFEEE